MDKQDLIEKLVHINRITKVVKGGRRFGFSALVVVGNGEGKIGLAHAKSKQVPDAIKKANDMARRSMIHVPLKEGRTIHHDIYSKNGSGKVILRSAPKGTGIIAGGPIRAVCEVLGIKDLVAKSLGRRMGKVIELPSDLRKMESETMVRVAIIEIDDCVLKG